MPNSTRPALSHCAQQISMYTLLAVALLGVATVEARQLPRGPVVKTTIHFDNGVPKQGYVDELSAVLAATERFNPDSVANNREHLGGILRCAQGRFFYTQGRGKRGQAPVRFGVSIPPGCTLTALWHTHAGKGHHRQLFSPSDTHTAEKLGKPFYLADYQGRLLIYRPGDPRSANPAITMSRQQAPKGSAKGRLVGNIGIQNLITAHAAD